MKKIAAFDIGSNAIRAAVGLWDGKKIIEITHRFNIPIRLGAEVFSTGEFSPATISKVADNFLELKTLIDKEAVEEIRAVATSAYRNAGNATHLQEMVLKKSGILIESITGAREAQMLRDALGVKMDLSKNYLLFDIGGGSIELSILKDGNLLAEKSFPLGTVRLLDFSSKNFNVDTKPLSKFFKHAAGIKKMEMIGTGGNFKSLLKLKKKIIKGKNADFVLPLEVPLILRELQALSYSERMEKFNLRPNRADVIVPALLLIEMVLKLCPQVSKIYAPDVGLIHGVLLSMAQGGKVREFID